MKKNRVSKKSRAKAKIARFFTALIVIAVIVCVILFANKNQAHAVEGDAAPLKKYYKTITIQPGDTLWSIAKEYKTSKYSTQEYVDELMIMNDLHNDNITSGMNLVVVYFN